TELLTAFPDIKFSLTDIVIGPQGVIEVADATGTRKGVWLGAPATNARVDFRVIIYFPWNPAAQKFAGEKVYVDSAMLKP
ncbi:MAG: ester cyclase, partial [Chloroflexi bacterium]|nr:ester cyclase [Chloroflexota bacterium]